MGFKRVWIKRMEEQNKVTGKNLLKDCLGRKMNKMVHKTMALNILKKLISIAATSSFS
jgi:hypothetical protein